MFEVVILMILVVLIVGLLSNSQNYSKYDYVDYIIYRKAISHFNTITPYTIMEWKLELQQEKPNDLDRIVDFYGTEKYHKYLVWLLMKPTYTHRQHDFKEFTKNP